MLPTPQSEMLSKALLAIAAPKHRAAIEGHLGDRRPARSGWAGLWGVRRALPHRPAPQRRRTQRHRRGHDDPRHADRRAEAAQLDTGALISAGQPAGWHVRPGSSPPSSAATSEVLDLGRNAASTPRPNGSRWPSRRRLHRRRLRLPTRALPRPPRPPLVPRRRHQRQGRPAPLPPAPRPAHDPAFTMTKLPGGKVAFTRGPRPYLSGDHSTSTDLPTRLRDDLTAALRARGEADRAPCWGSRTPTSYLAWPGTFR